MVKRVWWLLLAFAAHAAAAPADLFLEAELEPAEVAVQTQANYRLRLYQAVAVRDLVIGDPAAALAEFRAIGATRVHETVRDGRRYRVHERHYAVFPFASGSLAVAGVHAVAGVAAPQGWRTVRVDAPPLALTVLPVPADAGVAAQALRLNDTWTADPGGDVWRRDLRIEAEGIDAAQLPELRFAVPGASVHAEAARLENRFEGDLNVAAREQSFSVVMQHPGDIVVPELRLPWWDAATRTAAVAVLPARMLNTATAPRAKDRDARATHALLVAGLLCATALLAWRSRIRLRAAWRLRRAQRSGEPAAVRDALLDWAAAVRTEPAPRSLGALAATLDDPGARDALRELDRSLYGPANAGKPPVMTDIVRRITRGLHTKTT